MVMSRGQNAGRSYSMKTDNSFIERVEEFEYLGTSLTDQNSVSSDVLRARSQIVTHHVTRHNTPIHNILSTAPQSLRRY
jgi:hypothetical protein